MNMQCHDMLQNLVILACLGVLSWGKTLVLQLQCFHLLKTIKNSKENMSKSLFNVPTFLWVLENCETWWKNQSLRCGPNAKRINSIGPFYKKLLIFESFWSEQNN
jgi:hypothetical protein